MGVVQGLGAWIFRAYKSRSEWSREANAQSRFSNEVYCLLRSGGWYPGRSISAPDSLGWHPSAVSIVSEFGGLSFGADDGSGVGRTQVSVDMSPTWDDELKRHGLSEFGSAWLTVALFIGLNGIIYCDHETRDGNVLLKPIARTFDRTLELFLLGIKPVGDDIAGTEEIWHYA